MNMHQEFPSFDLLLPDLNQFIVDLVEEYKAEKISSWEDLEERVNAFFTPEQMDRTEAIVPHWRKMASYADGLTLVHVMCVFLGSYMMPEFLGMSEYQQALMKWVILFHDVEKEHQAGKRDHVHAFRSAVGAAQSLPKLGFPTVTEYEALIDEWSAFTLAAVTLPEGSSNFIQDNHKLPQILDGIERMFGHNTPTALIIKTILFHLIVGGNDLPSPSPLTDEEIKKYFDSKLVSLLLVMNLGDNDGWTVFEPEVWGQWRMDTIEVFQRVEHLVQDK